MSNTNNWNEWSQHVLKELERLNSCMTHLDDEMKKISVEIAMLKVKAGIWGVAGGSLPAVAAIIYKLLTLKP